MPSIAEIYAKLDRAFDSYTSDLENRQKELSPTMFGTMKDSIRTEDLGRFNARVGIDVGYLRANQLNKKTIDYATLYIKGHRQSPIVEFTNGVRTQFYKSGDWRGNPFISNAFHQMRSFSSYYKQS